MRVLFLVSLTVSCVFCLAEESRSASKEQDIRYKRSVEISKNLTDVDESVSYEEVETPPEEVENTSSIQTINSTLIFSRRILPTAPSNVQPVSVRTLPKRRPLPTSYRTLPTAGSFAKISSRTLPYGKGPSTPPKTFPSRVRINISPRTFPNVVRPTVAPRSYPSRRPSPASPRTFPPVRRIGLPRVFPSRRPGVLPVPRRFRPTSRTLLSRLRPALPTPRRNLPRPVRITRLGNTNLPVRRQPPTRRPLPRSFRNQLPVNRKSNLPEFALRPRKVLPTPRSIANRFQSRRVMPTSARRRTKFIHISESSQNRDYDGTIIGCPTLSGDFNTISMTQDGFRGIIRFSPLKESMTNGYLIKMKFNVPLKDVACNSLSEIECGANRREYCFVSNNPATVVEQNSEFSAYIAGNFSGLRLSRLRSSVEVMGVCSGPGFQVKTTNAPLVFQDFNNDRSEVREEDNGNGSEERTQSQRCDIDSPNGGVAEGGNTIPTWNRMNSEDGVDYNELLHKSILFYEAQRSGMLPSDNRILWRGDADLKDGCSIQADLTGGWYSAGGNVKSTPLIAFSTTLLIWGAIDYREAYIEAGEMENVLDQIRWATDYLIKCKTSPTTLVVQVGNSATSSRGWSRPEQTELSSRTISIADPTKPAADVAGEVAATLAAASILFNQTDANYAAKCLEVARELYEVAQANQKRYKYDSKNSAFSYGVNHNMKEEMAWASIWLYKATDEEEYLDNALNYFAAVGRGTYLFSMKQKSRAIAILLANESSNRQLMRQADQYIDWFLSRSSTNSKRLLYLTSKGSNMYTANAAFLALYASQRFGTAEEKNRTQQYAEELMATLAGVRGQGYVVGVGNNPPKQPHHQGSMCPMPPASCTRLLMFRNQDNPHVLYGALVSGIDRFGRYSDRRSDSFHNGVRIDYNAGFQGLAAGIIQLRSRD